MLDLDDFGTLAHGYTDAQLAKEFDVTLRTARNWRTGKTPVPLAVRRLLKIINWGDLEALGGSDWAGFTLNRDGTMSVPLFPRPLPAARIASMFFWEPEQQVRDLERSALNNATLSAELEKEKRRKSAAIEIKIDGQTVYASAPVDFT